VWTFIVNISSIEIKMYQIILTENNKKVKTLYSYTREHDALYRFTNISKKQTRFPKKQVYKNKILTEVFYHVLLIKKRNVGDKSIIVRDNYGKLLESFMEDPDWTVLGSSEYNIEEQFSVTGANRKLDLNEIINYVLLPKISEKNPKQILTLNNKVVIEGVTLNLVTCKNINETTRLYNKLRSYCYENKISNIIFFGSIPKTDKKVWYKKIHDITGIGYNRLYRKSSR
jgi:hypothetical protein